MFKDPLGLEICPKLLQSISMNLGSHKEPEHENWAQWEWSRAMDCILPLATSNF